MDEKKKAKGSYVKPTGTVSGANLFRKSTKIVHPSSASSSRVESFDATNIGRDEKRGDTRDDEFVDTGMFTSSDSQRLHLTSDQFSLELRLFQKSCGWVVSQQMQLQISKYPLSS